MADDIGEKFGISYLIAESEDMLDFFAGAALIGILASGGSASWVEVNRDQIARDAYAQARAMLRARKNIIKEN